MPDPEVRQAIEAIAAAMNNLFRVVNEMDRKTQPQAPNPTIAQAVGAARTAELQVATPALWANVTKAAGGYWVTTSFDPVETVFGPQVPEGGSYRFACASIDEAVEVMRRRMGE